MPSSAGLWAAEYAEGLIATAESLEALWRKVDRSPLGSAAGYGVPLPIRREVAMRALGFAGLDHAVTSVQLGRGKLKEGVYVVGFSYPVVPQGQARIRTQMSAAHTTAQLQQAVAAFAKVGRVLGVIP